METKKEKFERLAENRTNEAAKKIRLIGNLSNRNNYDYDKEHLDQIFLVLNEEIRDAKNKFELENKSQKNFKFK